VQSPEGDRGGRFLRPKSTGGKNRPPALRSEIGLEVIDGFFERLFAGFVQRPAGTAAGRGGLGCGGEARPYGAF